MAIFGTKQNTKKEKKTALSPVMDSVRATAGPVSSKKHAGDILLTPRITEKGSYLAEKDCYVFNVAVNANKKEISHAVQELFKVTPRAVRTVHIRGKKIVSRNTNRVGHGAEGKKAYVYLKKGEKIELV